MCERGGFLAATVGGGQDHTLHARSQRLGNSCSQLALGPGKSHCLAKTGSHQEGKCGLASVNPEEWPLRNLGTCWQARTTLQLYHHHLRLGSRPHLTCVTWCRRTGLRARVWVPVLCDLGQLLPSLNRFHLSSDASNHTFHQMDPCLAISLAVPLAACFLLPFRTDQPME